MAYQAQKHRVTRTKLLETCKTAETGFTTHSQVSRPPRGAGGVSPGPGSGSSAVCASFTGVGCEQEVQLCHSLHAPRRLHPLRRG